MSRLSTYVAKRKLDQTPEPKARLGKKQASLIFVVQKHHASHLHYDLRLELDGVLKSWAVPKGPPKTPEEKRLAIMVEDHPYEYKDFHGTIPAGNYGAGEVEIWDKGTYESGEENTVEAIEAAMRAGLKKGHVSLVFKGKKLKGEYALIKTKRMTTNKEEWLWIKKGNASKASTKTSAKDPMPTNIKPMLALSTDNAFNKKDWLFEVKWDGYRALAVVKTSKVELLSRNQKSFNRQFAPIVAELKKHLRHRAILDGEIVVLDASGRSNFQLIQNYGREQAGSLHYYVFDLLYLDGFDLRARPLIERKEMLEQLLAPLKKSTIHYSDHVIEKGVAFFKEAKKLGLEGIMAKDAESPYVMGRSGSWLKIKAQVRQEVVIGGYTKARGSRKELGALLVGVYEGKTLRYVGHVGTGFDEKTLLMLAGRLQKIIDERCPFAKKPKTNAQATFVKPRLVCEVSFTEWTKEGSLRHPVFLGLRTDKKPKEIVREDGIKGT